MKPIVHFTTTVMLGLLFFSCATDHYIQIDNKLNAGEYRAAVEGLESTKEKLYGKNAVLLYELDAGMLNHYAGNYDDSINLLQESEREIEAAYTKSISQIAASLANNDTSKSYSGEDYEDIYINTFNALNYYHKDKMEEALVEINRMNEKLAYLETKYHEMGKKLQEAADKKNKNAKNPQPENAASLLSSKFANSALGRYLGMLFYRGSGKEDDARIDRDWLIAAYKNAPEIYNFPVPSSIDTELEIPAGKARLNLISFGGMAPIKQERVTMIPLGKKNHIKIALPKLRFRPSRIQRVEAVIDNGGTVKLEQLESIEGVCKETFQNKIDMITFKTTLRATIKGVTAAAMSGIGASLEDSSDSDTAQLGSFFSLAGSIAQLAADLSEKADIRTSRFFPSRAYCGGVNLDPGVYSLKVNFYDADGVLLNAVQIADIQVKAGKLNLVEAVCLK
jgi:hypothetical protein